MSLSIDTEKCQGHGRCYALAPELFEPERWAGERSTRMTKLLSAPRLRKITAIMK